MSKRNNTKWDAKEILILFFKSNYKLKTGQSLLGPLVYRIKRGFRI